MAQLGRARAFHPIVSRGYAGTDTRISSDVHLASLAANPLDTLNIQSVRTASDSLGGSDSAVRASLAETRTAVDTLSASDAAVANLRLPRTATDALAASDVATRAAQVLSRSVSDLALTSEWAGQIGSVNLTDHAGAARSAGGFSNTWNAPTPDALQTVSFPKVVDPGHPTIRRVAPPDEAIFAIEPPAKGSFYINFSGDVPAGVPTGTPRTTLSINDVTIQATRATTEIGTPARDALAIDAFVHDVAGHVEVGHATNEGPAVTLTATSASVRTGQSNPHVAPDHTIQDVPGGARPFTYPAQLTFGVTLTSDVPYGAISGTPSRDQIISQTTLSAGVPGSALTSVTPVTLIRGHEIHDHPECARGCKFDASLQIGVSLQDHPDCARGCQFPATLAIDVVLSTDRANGTRGCQFPATVVADVVLHDKPIGSRGCIFPSAPVIGVTLTTDHPNGSRSCLFASTLAIGVNVTSDVHSASRAALTPSSLTGNLAFTGAVVYANPNWPLIGIDVDFTATSGPPAAIPGVNRVSLQAAYRNLGVRKITIQRGRQYELDQVQAGQCTIELPDKLEMLNPDNPNSPFNQNGNKILPYRPMWVWAMWPNQPGSGNIYANTVSPSADPSFEVAYQTGPINGLISSGSGTTFSTTTAQAFHGSRSLLVTQAGSGLSYGVYAKNYNYTVPEPTYTASAYVMPTGGCTVTIRVVDGAGNVYTGETASTQNVWQRIAVTWNAVETLEPIQLYATGVGNPVFYVDAMQLEFGTAATAFTTSGPTLTALFTGYVERFPTHYDFQGYRAVKPLQAVDALAILSRTSISQQYDEVIGADDPQWVMKFDDTSGPPLITGNPPGFARTQAPNGGEVNYSGDTMPDGTPAISLQQQIQSSDPVTAGKLTAATFPGATSITVDQQFNKADFIVIEGGAVGNTVDDPHHVEFAQVTAVKTNATTPATYTLTITKSLFGIVGLRDDHPVGASVVSFANQDTYVTIPTHASYSVNFGGVGATFEGWFKAVTGDVTFMLAGSNRSGRIPTAFNVSNSYSWKDTFVGLQTDQNGVKFVLNDTKNTITTGGKTQPANIPVYAHFGKGQAFWPYDTQPDGEWHYFAIRLFQDPIDPQFYTWRTYIDDYFHEPPTYVSLYQDDTVTGGLQFERVVSFNENFQVASGFTGAPVSTLSAARVAYYPYALDEGRLNIHYNRGAGYIGEFTGDRVARLLRQYWRGAYSVAGGFIKMANDYTYDPTVRTQFQTSGAGQSRTLLDVLQEVQETERGLLYVDVFGTVIFEDRESRYRNQISLGTFGENPNNAAPGTAGYEIPYSSYEVDFDPTYTFSQANITSPTNQNFLPLVNQSAENQYGQRVVTQQLQAYFDYDLQQAALFYLTRYAAPRTRLTKLQIKPAANPAAFPTVLGLELSQRYTVTRRSFYSGLAVSNDFYVEQINTTIDIETGEWSTDLQMSPVFVKQAWVLGDATYGVLGSTTYPIY